MQVFEKVLWCWSEPINSKNSQMMTERNIEEIVFNKTYNYVIDENIFPSCVKKISVYMHCYNTLNSIPASIEYLELMYDNWQSIPDITNLPSTIKQIRINGENLSNGKTLFLIRSIRKIPFGCEIFNCKDEKIF